ncbi:MDR/zinc-dependent alcohol dehydrogenase-like family protein [Nitratireductor basaltis]|uniref:Alcohol dehydrogenase GroES-like protein n=1 Tax=Nitratireductor basaltis TaxID=472175 RepID=A0A084UAU4_9HYPH|nr:zinc-binding dehydrogenase [Nitratireductor basaltis]KFB10080.1 Alcohol dehydrogenase GroES-like protein [Nitratireductor basaltis]
MTLLDRTHTEQVISKTMRAAVLTAPNRFEIKEVAIPEPKRGEVLVRLAGCGVCASNIEPWQGPEWMEYPTAPGDMGHEGYGTIAALGEGVTGLQIGMPVTTLFYNSYAEYDVGPAENVVPLPDGLSDKDFPGEPLGCAMNIFARSDIRPGQTVAIVGSGFLGALLCRLCVSEGARVIAVSRRDTALSIAKHAGARHVIRMDDHYRIIDEVKALTDGALCDRVIEATGKPWPLDLAGELTSERGRLVIAGYHQDGPRQINMQMWNWKGLDVINAHERDPERYLSGIRAAIDAVVAGKIDPSPLITHRYRLEELNQALQDARDRPDGFLKAVVRM